MPPKGGRVVIMCESDKEYQTNICCGDARVTRLLFQNGDVQWHSSNSTNTNGTNSANTEGEHRHPSLTLKHEGANYPSGLCRLNLSCTFFIMKEKYACAKIWSSNGKCRVLLRAFTTVWKAKRPFNAFSPIVKMIHFLLSSTHHTSFQKDWPRWFAFHCWENVITIQLQET